MTSFQKCEKSLTLHRVKTWNFASRQKSVLFSENKYKFSFTLGFSLFGRFSVRQSLGSSKGNDSPTNERHSFRRVLRLNESRRKALNTAKSLASRSMNTMDFRVRNEVNSTAAIRWNRKANCENLNGLIKMQRGVVSSTHSFYRDTRFASMTEDGRARCDISSASLSFADKSVFLREWNF